MKVVNEFLAKLGLSEIETKLYLGLLETGPTTVMELANHVGIKRITAHFNVESLTQKGLVTETRRGARRKIVAEDPDKLGVLIKDKEVELNQMKLSFLTILQTLQKSMPLESPSDKVEVRYYEGKKAVKRIYDEVLSSNELRAFVTSSLDNIFPENADLFIQTLHQRENMKIWEIIDDNPIHNEYVSKMNSDRYKSKVIGKQLEITDYLIFDNRVAIINVDVHREDKVTGLIITSDNFYKSSKTLFEIIWNVLP